jgi:N-sulfoglucosamine sulfohydrolase
MFYSKYVIISILAVAGYLTFFNGNINRYKEESYAARKMPNVLIVTVDDMTYNSIGVFGCKLPGITPNIDKLASEGMRFMHAFSNTAVCQPARQSFLTGRFPHNNGAEGFEPINEDVPTLPELLKKAGYFNGILGKEIHHQPVEKFRWDFIPFKTEKDSLWRKGESRSPALFKEYSARFFQMAKAQQQPFFLVANSHDPHRPFVGSAADTAEFGNTRLPVTRQFSPEEIDVPAYLPDIPDVRKETAQYYGSVYRADQNIGAVLDALDKSGLAANTIVIFLSDHGAAFPFGKSQCYFNSNKTPLIVKWPNKIKAGSIDSVHFVSGIDLMPTILDASRLPLVEDLDGRSFLPLLSGRKEENRNDVYTTYYQVFNKTRYPMRCIQDNNFGYIYNFWSDGILNISGDALGGLTWKAMVEAAKNDPEIAKRVELFRHRIPEEFYDFRNDPDALHNLINDPAYAGEIQKFRDKMLVAMSNYKDPALQTFRDREKQGVKEEFMKQQKIRSGQTGQNAKF